MPSKGFNINEHVWVKLTPHGKQKHLESWGFLSEIKRAMPPESAVKMAQRKGGWYEFQLWELMSIFGGEMRNGGPVSFVDNEIHFESPVEGKQ